MAAISNHISLYSAAARREAVPLARRRSIFGPQLREVMSNAVRLCQEILLALWMFAVLAFSLLIAVGFVV
jgi:hypothetical protein